MSHPVDEYLRLLKSVKKELQTCKGKIEPHECESIKKSQELINSLLEEQEDIRKCFEDKLKRLNDF